MFQRIESTRNEPPRELENAIRFRVDIRVTRKDREKKRTRFLASQEKRAEGSARLNFFYATSIMLIRKMDIIWKKDEGKRKTESEDLWTLEESPG